MKKLKVDAKKIHEQHEFVREVLIRFKGNLVLTAEFMDVRTAELRALISGSPILRMVLLEMRDLGKEDDFYHASKKQIQSAINERIDAYRLDAINVMYEVATMPLNLATAEVKLKAAAQICSLDVDGGTTKSTNFLDELALAYQQSAHRVRDLRSIPILVTEEPAEVLTSLSS